MYSPPNPLLRLWDTWILQEGEDYHLFHLQRHPQEVGCSSIGHAVTRDWLNWKTLPPILEQGTGSDWDAGPLMTGMTIKHEGRYYLFYGAMVNRVQRIGIAVSDDLTNWEKWGHAPVLEPGGEWYQTDPTEAINYETAWRDPYVFYYEPENCFYAFICARIASASEDIGGGCVAVARSENLLDWELLPPAYISETLTCLEVPEYFMLGGRHYLSFTTSYHFGTPYPLRDAYQASGTFYLMSENMLSQYAEPEHHNILHAGLPNQPTNYVGRSINIEGNAARRIFYYHHVLPIQPDESVHGSLSAPKYLESDPGGQLRVMYAENILHPLSDEIAMYQDPLSRQNLLTLVDEDTPDGIFEAIVKTPYAGICFRMGQHREGALEGLAVWLAPCQPGNHGRRVILGTLHVAEGPFGKRPAFGNPAALRTLESRHDISRLQVRLVCRSLYVDVYIDDVLYLSHTYDPKMMPSQKGVGIFYAGIPKDSPVEYMSVRRFNSQ